MWFLSFIVLIWCIALIDFWMLNQTCINSTWQWHEILFMCCWIQFVKILRNFACMFMRDVGLWFCFPEITLSDFYIRLILDSWNEIGSVSLSSGFSVCKELELFLFYLFGRNHQWIHLGQTLWEDFKLLIFFLLVIYKSIHIFYCFLNQFR